MALSPYIVAWSVCMSSVTVLHPAKAIRWNEMPFSRVTCVVPSNIILNGAPVPHGKDRFGGRNHQFAAVPPITKVLQPLLQLLYNAAGYYFR